MMMYIVRKFRLKEFAFALVTSAILTTHSPRLLGQMASLMSGQPTQDALSWSRTGGHVVLPALPLLRLLHPLLPAPAATASLTTQVMLGIGIFFIVVNALTLWLWGLLARTASSRQASAYYLPVVLLGVAGMFYWPAGTEAVSYLLFVAMLWLLYLAFAIVTPYVTTRQIMQNYKRLAALYRSAPDTRAHAPEDTDAATPPPSRRASDIVRLPTIGGLVISNRPATIRFIGWGGDDGMIDLGDDANLSGRLTIVRPPRFVPTWARGTHFADALKSPTFYLLAGLLLALAWANVSASWVIAIPLFVLLAWLLFPSIFPLGIVYVLITLAVLLFGNVAYGADVLHGVILPQFTELTSVLLPATRGDTAWAAVGVAAILSLLPMFLPERGRLAPFHDGLVGVISLWFLALPLIAPHMAVFAIMWAGFAWAMWRVPRASELNHATPHPHTGGVVLNYQRVKQSALTIALLVAVFWGTRMWMDGRIQPLSVFNGQGYVQAVQHRDVLEVEQAVIAHAHQMGYDVPVRVFNTREIGGALAYYGRSGQLLQIAIDDYRLGLYGNDFALGMVYAGNPAYILPAADLMTGIRETTADDAFWFYLAKNDVQYFVVSPYDEFYVRLAHLVRANPDHAALVGASTDGLLVAFWIDTSAIAPPLDALSFSDHVVLGILQGESTRCKPVTSPPTATPAAARETVAPAARGAKEDK